MVNALASSAAKSLQQRLQHQGRSSSIQPVAKPVTSAREIVPLDPVIRSLTNLSRQDVRQRKLSTATSTRSPRWYEKLEQMNRGLPLAGSVKSPASVRLA